MVYDRWCTRPQMVTHPSTNRAWRRVTTLIETNALPLSQTTVIYNMHLYLISRIDRWSGTSGRPNACTQTNHKRQRSLGNEKSPPPAGGGGFGCSLYQPLEFTKWLYGQDVMHQVHNHANPGSTLRCVIS